LLRGGREAAISEFVCWELNTMNENEAGSNAPTKQPNVVWGCLGLVLVSGCCLVGAGALVYGAQWLLGW
jgi:hypothetical protein